MVAAIVGYPILVIKWDELTLELGKLQLFERNGESVESAHR